MAGVCGIRVGIWSCDAWRRDRIRCTCGRATGIAAARLQLTLQRGASAMSVPLPAVCQNRAWRCGGLRKALGKLRSRRCALVLCGLQKAAIHAGRLLTRFHLKEPRVRCEQMKLHSACYKGQSMALSQTHEMQSL